MSESKPKKEPLFLHDRKCLNKTCPGGTQEIIEEYGFRGTAMVRLHCVPCSRYSKLKTKKGDVDRYASEFYSVTLNSLNIDIISLTQSSMKKYKVLVDFIDVNRLKHLAGEVVVLSDKDAERFKDLIEPAEELATPAPANEPETTTEPTTDPSTTEPETVAPEVQPETVTAPQEETV